MTQSGQGEEPRLPAARPVREGIVLPADGSEPLLPGTTGDQTAPAGGRPWGQPWGPEQAPPAPPTSGSSGYEWGAATGQGAGAPGTPYGGVPGWETAPDATAASTAPSSAPWDAAQPPQQPLTAGPYPGAQHAGPQVPGAHQPGGGPAPLPPTNAFPTSDQGAAGPGGVPGEPLPSAGGYGGALPPAPSTGFGMELPSAGPQAGPAAGLFAQAGHGGPLPQAGQGGALPPAGHGGPLPVAGDAGPLPAVVPSPGHGHGSGPQPPHGQGNPPLPAGQATAALSPDAHGAALPPAVDPSAEATQYMPPVAGTGAQAGAAGGFDEGATQYIPPVAPGALPPEAAADATQYLGRAPRNGATAGTGPDSEPTQYIAPVPAPPPGAPYGIRPGAPGDRQAPPAEFDSLFRAEPESEGPAATQQLPRFQPPTAAGGHYGAAAPETGGRAAARQASEGRGSGRTRSKLPLVAAAGIGIAVLGIGAGALLGAGGDDTKDDSKAVSATAPASESASPTADPTREQAVALDKLLADSNNSRDAVIKAVADVRACNNLGQAATDLRNAAKQRNDLVTRLAQLSVDKLPNNAQLTTALNNAWKASASADNHYAAWADEVAGKKGCRKGEARVTANQRAGNRASGTATTQKTKAATLWNAIALQYDLTQRKPYQL
ncbi:hypothetical protein ABT009_31745 [Streptomyces sp. NPDC002896]|uniref:hypothetical protein n=1 Tax=Streptomyces sp. NPDC002896 TaxID=3154438 RepID=UPI003320FFF5